MLSERPDAEKLRRWAYSRLDTIRRPGVLKLLRKAGIKWLCLGIESADRNIRLEVSKGKFEDVNIVDVVGQIHDADIGIIANYMFGLPGDTHETMQDTLDFALDNPTEMANFYSAMDYPGSPLYKEAIKNKIALPETYSGYCQASYETHN